MPYKSKKQQRFMNAVHPDIAARWNKYPMPKYQKSPDPLPQQGIPQPKQRRGFRENYDYKAWNPSGLQFPTSFSSHLMKAEEVEGRGWVGFPSLFQDSKPYADDQQNWHEVSEEYGWGPIYNEAKRRGEVYDFGKDKKAALAFGKGSWKDQSPWMKDAIEKQKGGYLPSYQATAGPVGKDYIADYDAYKAEYPISSAYLKAHPIGTAKTKSELSSNLSWNDYLNRGSDWANPKPGSLLDYFGSSKVKKEGEREVENAHKARFYKQRDEGRERERIASGYPASAPFTSEDAYSELEEEVKRNKSPIHELPQVESILSNITDEDYKSGAWLDKNMKAAVASKKEDDRRKHIASQKRKEDYNTDLSDALADERITKKQYLDAQTKLATGRTETVPYELAFFPGTPAIKGVSKLGNWAVDAFNPLSGIRSDTKSLALGPFKYPLKITDKFVKKQGAQGIIDIAGKKSVKETKEALFYENPNIYDPSFYDAEIDSRAIAAGDEYPGITETIGNISAPGYQTSSLLPTYQAASTSITGYQGKGPNSGPYIIPSGDITMKGVNFPIQGTDNLGNTKIMKPGKNYKFPGNSVYEIPAMKKGGKIGCGCKGACAKCGGHIPKYFAGGDIDWGNVAQASAAGAAAGSVVPGWGTAIGGVIGAGTALYGQSQAHKAKEQEEEIAEEQKAAAEKDVKQFQALNQYIQPGTSNNPPSIDYGGSWQGLETPMFSQTQKAPNYGTPFYKQGGRLPSYQASAMGPPDYSQYYGQELAALNTEKQRVSDVTAQSLQAAKNAASSNRDFLRPITGSKRDQAAKAAFAGGTEDSKDNPTRGYKMTPEGAVKCYGDTCIYSATTLKNEAGAGHRPVTGNYTFASKAGGFGYEKVPIGEKKPGDIVQFMHGNSPYHAVTMGEGDDIYYDPGSYFPGVPYKKDKYSQYIYEGSGNDARAFRYVGDKRALESNAELARQEMLKDPQAMNTLPVTPMPNTPTPQLMMPSPVDNSLAYNEPGKKKWWQKNSKSYKHGGDLTPGATPMVSPGTTPYSGTTRDYTPDEQWIKEIMDYERKQGGYDEDTGKTYGKSNAGYNYTYNDFLGRPIYAFLEGVGITTSPLEKFKEEYLPGLIDTFPDIEERKRAGDFVYNTGTDARVYQLHQYLKDKGEKEGFKDRKRYTKGEHMPEFEKKYKSLLDEIDALDMGQQLDIMDRGKDWYHRNTNTVDGKPNPRYDATWKHRPWSLYNSKRKKEEELETFKKGGTMKKKKQLPGYQSSSESLPNYNTIDSKYHEQPNSDMIPFSLKGLMGNRAIVDPNYISPNTPIIPGETIPFSESYRRDPDNYFNNFPEGDISNYNYDKAVHAMELGNGEGFNYGPWGSTRKDPSMFDVGDPDWSHLSPSSPHNVDYTQFDEKENLETEPWEEYGRNFQSVREAAASGLLPPSGPRMPLPPPDARTAFETSSPLQEISPNQDPVYTTMPGVGTSKPGGRRGGLGKGLGKAAPYLLGAAGTIWGASQLGKNKNNSKQVNPYAGMQNPQMQSRSSGRGSGMDIPTAQSLGFTQSYPSLYAKKGGNLPMYQASSGRLSDRIRPGSRDPFTGKMSYGTMEGNNIQQQGADFADLPMYNPAAQNIANPDANMSTVPNMFYAQQGGNIYNQQNPHQGATFEAERPEVVKHEENNHPIALAHGGTVSNSSNFTKLTGNRHSDSEGGIQMTGAEGGFVYSDFINVPKDLEDQLKNIV